MLVFNETLNIAGIYETSTLAPFFLQNMFVIMSLIFLAFFAVLALNLPDIRKQISGINRETLLALLLILAVGFCLRNADYMYGYGVDGIHYTESARIWLETGIFMKGCAIGEIGSCRLYSGVLFPAGFPFIILLLYSMFGVNSLAAMVFNGIFSSATILLVFFISKQLFKRDDVSLYSAMIFSLVPIDIFIGGSAAVRSISLFFTGLTVFFFLMATENKRMINWIMVSLAFSLSIFMRQENSILIIPLAMLFWFRCKQGAREFLFSSRFLIPLAFLIITQIPVQHFIIFSSGLSPPGMSDFSLSYLPLHFPILIQGLFLPANNLAIFSPIASILLFFSLIFLWRRDRRETAFLWLWFLSLFLLYSLYFFCPSLSCLEYPRYMSSLSVAYSILAGLSLSWISMRLKARIRHFLPASFVVLFLTSGLAIPITMFADARMNEQHLGDQLTAIEKSPPGCTVMIRNYMAAGSDVLSQRRRSIDIDLIMPGTRQLALQEMKDAECLVLVSRSVYDKTEISEQIPVIGEDLELELYFQQGDYNVYNATLRGVE
jgi:hypothetical protein